MYGPYTLQTIKEKGIKPSDLVWYDGLKDWTPAENIDFLTAFLTKDKENRIRKKSILEKVFSFLN